MEKYKNRQIEMRELILAGIGRKKVGKSEEKGMRKETHGDEKISFSGCVFDSVLNSKNIQRYQIISDIDIDIKS